MMYKIAYALYVLSLLFASLCSVVRFRKIDYASKILSLLISCDFVVEIAAYFFAKKYHNNLPLYAIDELVEYGLLCWYFNYVIDVFRKRNIGIYLSLIGICLGILNLKFVQNINSQNSYFLFFEGLLVLGMCLFTFFRLLLDPNFPYLYRYHHFWFTSILVFFWCITFLNWGLYDYLNLKLKQDAWIIDCALPLVGAITYTAFGVVFLSYNKLQKK